jgi:hypothetical protein
LSVVGLTTTTHHHHEEPHPPDQVLMRICEERKQ